MSTMISKTGAAIVIAVCSLVVSTAPAFGLAHARQATGIASGEMTAAPRDFTGGAETTTERNLPSRLKIPSLKINSAIEHVGLTNTGAMRVPKISGNVGWYSLGPRPGEYGSAVIAGHYSWRGNDNGGVFRNLSKLAKGDMIYIVDNKGKTVVFRVRENRTYNFDADARAVFAPDKGIRLNLITCAGTWNSSEQSSTKRRVIFADLVNPTEGFPDKR